MKIGRFSERSLLKLLKPWSWCRMIVTNAFDGILDWVATLAFL